jgi:general L-amino acid transport system substrate-binding protein
MVMLGLTALSVAYGSNASASVLDEVRKRGSMNCGVYPNYPGFSSLDANGAYVGFDVDICKVVATAANVNVKIVPVTANERFAVVAGKSVDLLSQMMTWTAGRDVTNGMQFTTVVFHDGQGFATRKSNNIKSARELSGATICISQGSTLELNVADWFRTQNLKLNAITFSNPDEVVRAYEAERCDAFAGGLGSLFARVRKLKNPDDHIILPEVVSNEPLTPAVAEGDPKWLDIVNWSIFALIIAEERGITSKNVEELARTSEDPAIRRLLGVTGTVAKDAGLDPQWAVRVIKAHGNYGEIFDRNLGAESPFKMERGLNQLWNKGGLIFAPPYR